jgi:hypothetical protein
MRVLALRADVDSIYAWTTADLRIVLPFMDATAFATFVLKWDFPFVTHSGTGHAKVMPMAIKTKMAIADSVRSRRLVAVR